MIDPFVEVPRAEVLIMDFIFEMVNVFDSVELVLTLLFLQ